MSGCEACKGCCGGCGALVLAPAEVEMLKMLAQIPFLPVARRADSPAPIYLGEEEPEESSLVLECLEKRGLISIDFDQPLSGFAYGDYPVRGSFALTARGQQVLELLEIQGAD